MSTKPKPKLTKAEVRALSKIKLAGNIRLALLDKGQVGVGYHLAPHVKLAQIISPVHAFLEDMISFYESTGPDCTCKDFVDFMNLKKLEKKGLPS